jgi:hypothetical protein
MRCPTAAWPKRGKQALLREVEVTLQGFDVAWASYSGIVG